MLFLWKLSQEVNNDYGTYDSAVVVSACPAKAKLIHPARYSDTGEPIFWFDTEDECWRRHDDSSALMALSGEWAQPEDIKVECVGQACEGRQFAEGYVVLASYNAG